MPREKNQTIKIVRILDILKSARGEEAALTTQQITAILSADGISCDRRTLSENFLLLQEYISSDPSCDFDLVCKHTPRCKLYYSVTRENTDSSVFSFEELRDLINGINSLPLTDSISEESAARLKSKLLHLAPESSRKKLQQYADDESIPILDTISAKILIDSINSLTFMKSNMTSRIIDAIIRIADTEDRNSLNTEKNNPLYYKHSTEGITIYEIDNLRRAVDCGSVITFRYFDVDENKNKLYHHDGANYRAEPLFLVPNDGHYYLICYDANTSGNIRTYRIDRMTDIHRLDESISAEARTVREKNQSFTSQVFRMFSGPLKSVTLSFGNKLINQVYDKFGPDVTITRINESRCTITEDIQISPPFWGWLFQFSENMMILDPPELVDEYRQRCAAVIEATE